MGTVTTALDIANLALAKISAGTITDFTTTRTGQVAARHFENAMDEVVSHEKWFSLKTRFTATPSAATLPGYAYSVDLDPIPYSTYDNTTAYTTGNIVYYSGSLYEASQDTTGNLPTNATYWGAYTAAEPDVLWVQELESGMPFAMEGRTLYTNDSAPVLVYFKKLRSTSNFKGLQPHLVTALAYKLAQNIVYELGGDKNLQAACLQEYMTALTLARQFNATQAYSHAEVPTPWSEA